MKYLLQTQIGLEKITELELSEKFKGMFSLDFSGYIPHKNGIIQIDWRDGKNKFDYNSLGTIEDAYFVLEYVKDIYETVDIYSIHKLFDIKTIKSNLDYFFDNENPFDKNNNFRLVVRKKSAHNFRRIDLQNETEKFFNKKITRAKITKKEGSKEIWVTLLKNRLIVAVRLTTKEKRQGVYKNKGVHGSLRPAVAYAMAFLSEIKSKDVIWDPFCGAGTIPAEIIENFNFGKLFCSDISEDAIAITKDNLNSTKKYSRLKGKVSIREEDFFFSKKYANLIISNLPFGVQYAIDSDFIKKFTSKINEIRNLRQITILFPELLSFEGWQMTRKFLLQLLGRNCYIQVFRKVRSL